MSWKLFATGAAIGLISGFAVKEIISQKKDVTPEKVLTQVKKQFSRHSPINGSWIHTEPESYEKPPIRYRVYKGGISRSLDGVDEQFEFTADAATGTILDVQKLPG